MEPPEKKARTEVTVPEMLSRIAGGARLRACQEMTERCLAVLLNEARWGRYSISRWKLIRSARNAEPALQVDFDSKDVFNNLDNIGVPLKGDLTEEGSDIDWDESRDGDESSDDEEDQTDEQAKPEEQEKGKEPAPAADKERAEKP